MPNTVIVPSAPTTIVQTTPQATTTAQPTPTQDVTATTAMVTIVVPKEDAQVWLGSTEMTGSGLERRFQSPPLEAGKRYTYAVRARWSENGKALEGSQSVEVKQGSNIVVDFRGAPPKQ